MKKLAFVILFGLYVHVGLAQLKPFSKAEALQIAYFTKELSLTSEEAQKFWPIYFNYRSDLKTARQENKDELDWEQNALNIRKKYRDEFKKILIDEQRALKVFKADRSFREMLRKEQERRKKNNKYVSPDNKISEIQQLY